MSDYGLLHCGIVIAVLLVGPSLAAAQQHALVHAKDGSGVFGYKDTPVQPWSGYHTHDPDRPVPPKVDPGPVAAPSDAIALFDGKDAELRPKACSRSEPITARSVFATSGSGRCRRSVETCPIITQRSRP